MPRLRITGGPHPESIRIQDTETGAFIQGAFTGFEVSSSSASGALVTVKLTAHVAELDLVAEQEG